MPLLLLTLLALLLLAPTASAQAPAEVNESMRIKTKDGDEVFVKVRRPAGDAKVPIILTYSPYNILDEGSETSDSYGDRYVPKGYARAVADVIGTRNSSGCFDYGGLKEQQSGVDLVNELAKQPWSNGKVAMIGASYDGTTANMVAARGADVPGLAAIVPVVAISRWYGYAYSHGIRYSGNTQRPTDEGFDTPLAFDFGFGRIPPTGLSPAAAAARVRECGAVEHTEKGYSETPDYDRFWLERDYRKDAAKVQVPALVVHGWQDFNVKQEEGIEWYKALPGKGAAFKKLFTYQGPHGNPGPTTGAKEYTELLDAFFAKTLLGVDNGVENSVPVFTQTRTAAGAEPNVRTETSYPPASTQTVELPFTGGGAGQGGKPAGERSYTDMGGGTEEEAGRNPDLQRQWLTYKSEPVGADVRLIDSAALALSLKVNRASGDLVPTLFDVPPTGTPVPITRGFLDLRYRDGLEKAKPVPVGEPVAATVTFKPQDWTVRKGHRLMVILQSSNTGWAVPAQPGLTVRVLEADSKLTVPVVDAATAVGAIPGARLAPQPVREDGPAQGGPGGSTVPGATNPGTTGPAKPGAKPKLTARLRKLARRGSSRVSRKRPARLRAFGTAPSGRYVLVRLVRGSRTVLTRKVKVVRGRYGVTFRVRRGGAYRVVATLPGARVRTGASRLR